MKKVLYLILFTIILLGSGKAQKTNNSTKNVQIVEEKLSTQTGPLEQTMGIPAYSALNVNYTRKSKKLFTIQFLEPVTISIASKPETWGYFQFPNIGLKADGSLQAKWNMTRDAIEAYGTDNSGIASSTDGGKTWKLQDKSETVGGLLLPDGSKIKISTPKPIKVEDLKLPKPVGIGYENYGKSKYTFYRLDEMPDSRKTVYLQRLKKGEAKWVNEQASLNDPKAARYSLSGLVPVVWWGDMHMAKDGSVIAGIYPGFLIGEDGLTDPRSGVFFYRSTDNGHSWNIQGRIPYRPELVSDPNGDKRMGFTEPAFEILKDGTFLCVMRTTDGIGNGPMYASYSKDLGKTWTTPETITAAGVLPQLLILKNGIVVLASGRPGVQLRFSTDGKGKNWSDPFEMLPLSSNLKAELGWSATVSCGYTGLISTGRDSFIIIYSDFNYKTTEGNIRKAIKVKEVIVKPG